MGPLIRPGEHRAPLLHSDRTDRVCEFIDVSHVVENGMITYKGIPAPVVCDFLSREESRSRYAPGTEFQIGRIDMVANTGTYVDAPFHRYAEGADLSELTLEQIASVEGLVVAAPVTEGPSIGPGAFEHLDVRGRAVLVHTAWDRHWGTATYFEDHPFLTEAAAEHLKEQGAQIVGIDSHNIDDTRGNARPVHTVLLGAGIPIVEHLRGLERLPATGFRFFAVPVKVRGMGTFPVRAFGIASLE